MMSATEQKERVEITFVHPPRLTLSIREAGARSPMMRMVIPLKTAPTYVMIHMTAAS